MTDINFIINVIGNFLCIAFVVIQFCKLKNISLTNCKIIIVLITAFTFLEIGGIPLYYYLRTVIGNLSITSITLITAVIYSYNFQVKLFKKLEVKKIFYIITVAGAFLYPFSLGFTYFDPYSYGFYPQTFIVILFVLFMIIWFLRLYITSLVSG